ncbi:hypothetical protein NLG97_g9481 [Lecanicillium saksenae]|uniref:Uncharacterized protein n=1 Tax=Lecanicillium saksenae TaxID=468837 RepID=A0ACC1QIW3_9HYPO|nr:hypothetical protein NLG97_g9481 [Lecanicillium saksenae]
MNMLKSRFISRSSAISCCSSATCFLVSSLSADMCSMRFIRPSLTRFSSCSDLLRFRASVSKAVREAASKAPNGETGVIYIGRIPHGFYEHEMRQYFSQFGPIARLRLSRNKKTGASKHFAFVEFEEQSTAEVVAKTMDNYLLFGHILKCQVVPKERVHEDLFKGANRRFKKVPWNKMAGKKLEKPRTESAWELKVERENKKRADKATKLKALGYDFEGPEIKAVPAPGAPATTENGDATETKAVEEAPVEEPKAEEPKAKSPKVTKAKGSRAKKVKA